MSSKFQEKLLLLRLKKKDPDAFAELYDQYVKAIYRFIFFKVPTSQDAEDLTSEVFLKVWQYISEKNQTVGNLRALLYRTARNCVVDLYRQRAKTEMVGDEDVLLNLEDGRQQNFLEQIDIKTEIKSLEEVLHKMKDEYREVILLKYIEELSITEISEVLQKTKGSVRVLIHRALKVVKDLTEQEKQE